MPNLAIIAYPILPDEDREWIEAVRYQHDPRATLLGAHFTFVFPMSAEAASVVAHATAITAQTAPIAFALRKVSAVRDALTSGSHVFLVPDEGHEAIVSLHDRLYAGAALRAHLRLDIPFIPHITVAAFDAFEDCPHLVDRLNAQRRVLRGRIAELEVVELDALPPRTTVRLALGG